jgi:hypothetical protein
MEGDRPGEQFPGMPARPTVRQWIAKAVVSGLVAGTTKFLLGALEAQVHLVAQGVEWFYQHFG